MFILTGDVNQKKYYTIIFCDLPPWWFNFKRECHDLHSTHLLVYTVCPGSSDPPENILHIFASENEVYTIF